MQLARVLALVALGFCLLLLTLCRLFGFGLGRLALRLVQLGGGTNTGRVTSFSFAA